MKDIDHFEVVAGWKPDGEDLIGKCDINRVRGREVISFMYDQDWIRRNPGFIIDPMLVHVTGRQYPPEGKNTFGFLADIAPDRWGRKLMERKELEDSKIERRAKRTLMESDYILMVSDESRQGGIRLRTEGVYQNIPSPEDIPPLTDIRTLESASISLESHSGEIKKWLRQLMAPGSSLGGARPKANVRDTDGSLWIAKFPSVNDDHDVGAWEMTAHDLATLCGLKVPEAMTMKLSSHGTTFLTKRFDRVIDNKGLGRNHFASAMTMLERTDGDTEMSGYTDIASVIEKICMSSVCRDLNELWRRMVFNILIGNTDDHLRNHGFTLNSKSEWELSPAYDINPSPDSDTMSLNIDLDSNDRDLDRAISVSGLFRVSEMSAKKETEAMIKTISENWRRIAKQNHIPKGEQDYMQSCFLGCIQ